MNCDVCKGTGTQTVMATVIKYGEAPKKEPPVKINCVWCNGSGQMSADELQELQEIRDMEDRY